MGANGVLRSALNELLRTPLGNCPKSLGDVSGVAPKTTEEALFDPFGPPHSGRIHLRSVAQTPFRTVSGRSSQNPL